MNITIALIIISIVLLYVLALGFAMIIGRDIQQADEHHKKLEQEYAAKKNKQSGLNVP